MASVDGNFCPVLEAELSIALYPGTRSFSTTEGWRQDA